MKRYPVFLSLFAFAAAAQTARGQIIISEVMFNPRGNEQANEFVELYNISATDSVSLAGWQIGERGAFDEIVAHTRGLVLQPQSFALILDPTYFQASTQYDSLFPFDALIITIDDNTLGNGGLSNSTAETVFLLNAEGDTVAQYTYSVGNADGISDEKIELNEDDSASNWANALRVNGTPGFANSVTRAQIDGTLTAQSLAITPYPLRENTPASISVLLRNVGRETLAGVNVDFDLIPRGREFGAPIYLGNVAAQQTVASNDTLRLHFNAPAMKPGRYNLLATLTIANDVNAANDTVSLPIAVGWARETIIINEIMFEPASGQPEWIEIFNPQNFSLPLPDWVVEDESGAKGAITQTIFIPPKSYRVLTASKDVESLFNLADTAIILLNRFPSLNNSGDAVFLRDFSGALIDSIVFEKEWGEAGKSIEKIWYERANVQRNWLPSKSHRGATPATFNSVSPRAYDLEINPLRFVPEQPQFGEAVHLEAIVRNNGRNALAQFTVTLFYDTSSAANWNLLSATSFTQTLLPEDSVSALFVWQAPPAGKIRLMAEVSAATDFVAENNRVFAQMEVGFAARVIVLNEVMFDPPEGEAEWVEIFNPNNAAVSLCNWQVEDEAQSRAMINAEIFIPPRSFRVLTASASLALQYGLPDSLVIVLQSFPSLNQSGEVVRLRDLNNNVIDSLAYEGEWGERAKSLEKIWFERGNDKNNWRASAAERGATPAAFNSVSPREYDLAVQALRFSPSRPQYGESVQLQAQIVNHGRRAIESFSALFYSNPSGTQDWTLLSEVLVTRELPSGDSVLVLLDWPQPPSGKHAILIETKEARDFVKDNDRVTARLAIGYPPRSVVLNEIYYDARSNEIEWFELFNRSSNAVDLAAWLWQDAEANAPAVFPDTTLILAPGKFAVISPNGTVPLLETNALHIQISRWLTLNNDAESVRLFDFNGGKQDSIYFHSRWGGASGFSLERINPNLATQDSGNWNTCADHLGATPGRPNSIFTEITPSSASLTVSPSPFSPDDDGVDDFTIFQMNLPTEVATFDLKIYDLRGRLIRHLVKSGATGSRREVVWNGRDDQGHPVRTGLYIAYVQAIRAEHGILISAKTTIVLARAMN